MQRSESIPKGATGAAGRESRKSPSASDGWVAAAGRITHVQPVGVDPKQFDEDATEAFGVGAFLRASSEVYRMVGGGQ